MEYVSWILSTFQEFTHKYHSLFSRATGSIFTLGPRSESKNRLLRLRRPERHYRRTVAYLSRKRGKSFTNPGSNVLRKVRSSKLQDHPLYFHSKGLCNLLRIPCVYPTRWTNGIKHIGRSNRCITEDLYGR